MYALEANETHIDNLESLRFIQGFVGVLITKIIPTYTGNYMLKIKLNIIISNRFYKTTLIPKIGTEGSARNKINGMR